MGIKKYALDGSNCDSYYGCSAKMIECDKGGTYVLATDYAALEAERDALRKERDELQRRLDAVVKDLEPKPGPPNPTNPTAVDVAIWRESRSIHRRISRIAEGRDNG